MAKGTLIPVGGNEKKGHEMSESETLEFIEDGILSSILKESGGLESNIVIVPTASSIQKEVSDNYIKAFTKLGCKNIKVLFINSNEEANAPESLQALKQADCVMFTGGDQSKIVDHISNTEFHAILQDRYENEHFVIAGTSAGAMAMSQEMISGGNITDFLFKGAVKMRKGMSFNSNLIIDSHFIKRGRFGRLTEAVATFPDLIGVGLAEDTGIVIRDGIFTVIGSGMVVVFDPSRLTHNHRSELEDNMPLSMAGLIVHVLAFGDQYDIHARETKIMSLEAYQKP